MMNAYYEDAYKLANKEYRRCVSKGIYPYLPVLDHIVSDEAATKGVNMGIINVPAEFIVGTKTAGRTRAFAANFMPLMKKDTEFAEKWSRLCKAHLEEGIRDAVKVYEYMNRYYVEEGNKRVSVLKFFDAVSIPATVIRILPENNDAEEVVRYQELLEFEKVTGIFFIEFSRKGYYEKLLTLLGKSKEDIWTEDEQRAFTSVYYYFKKTYEKHLGKRSQITPSDALLSYVKVFGFDALKNAGASEIRKNLSKITEEIMLMKEEEPILLKLEPEKSGVNLISQMMNKTVAPVKRIAFVHEKNPQDSGWTSNHEIGRVYVQEHFGDKILTSAYFDAERHGYAEVIEQAIADGNQVIFTTSPRLHQASLKAAVEHPKVEFLNCSLNKNHRYVRSYYARIYEAKFIAGAIAANMTDNDKLGYICTYPIYGQIAGINAFALGAQMVNDKAKVYLEWAESGNLKASVEKLEKEGVHYISSVEYIPRKEEEYKYFGLLKAEGDQIQCLAIPQWNWGVYYEYIIGQILDGSYHILEEESKKALNYYWGMSAGVIDIMCSSDIPAGARKLASFLKSSISCGHGHPFMAPIYTQEGDKIDNESGSISMEDIINMDYLVENIVGSMPSFLDLSPGVQATAAVMGVEKITKQLVETDEAVRTASDVEGVARTVSDQKAAVKLLEKEDGKAERKAALGEVLKKTLKIEKEN